MPTLDDWLRSRWLTAHVPSRHELVSLFAIVDRDLADSAIQGLSLDTQLGLLYNVGLKLADIALRLNGFRATRENAHYRIIQSLPHTLGAMWAESTLFLDHVRTLRHRGDYESVGVATQDVVHELREELARLEPAVRSAFEEDALQGRV